MIETLAFTIIVATGLYFCGLGAASLATPARAGRFLLGFASTQPLHYTELFLRLAVGWAFLTHAPRMFAAGAFSLFGWVLVVTTICLLLLPWRWHHRFAGNAVPRALRHLTLIGVASLAIGMVIVWAAIHGGAA